MSIINAIFQVLFQGCVNLLLWLGDLTGLGYVGINVVIFCFIWPVVTVWLVWRVRKLGKDNRLLTFNNGAKYIKL